MNEYNIQLHPLIGVVSEVKIEIKLCETIFNIFNDRNSIINLDNCLPLPRLNGLVFRYTFNIDNNKFNLSPNDPSSPLYPDGLFHLQWIRKYFQFTPAWYIVFLDMADEDTLVHKILEHRKTKKNSSFIILSRQHPSDEIYHSIRRNCNLDKTCLHFISLNHNLNLLDFVYNYEKQSCDNIAAFYREMGKRVKRKKSKLSTPSNKTLNLGIKGWTFRYEFKMGCFAEFLLEFDMATRHFITAYNCLYDILNEIASGTSTTPAFSKMPVFSNRWEEMILLADALTFKICKFLLFSTSFRADPFILPPPTQLSGGSQRSAVANNSNIAMMQFGSQPHEALFLFNRHLHYFHEIRSKAYYANFNPFNSNLTTKDVKRQSLVQTDPLSKLSSLPASTLDEQNKIGLNLLSDNLSINTSTQVNTPPRSSPTFINSASPSTRRNTNVVEVPVFGYWAWITKMIHGFAELVSALERFRPDIISHVHHQTKDYLFGYHPSSNTSNNHNAGIGGNLLLQAAPQNSDVNYLISPIPLSLVFSTVTNNDKSENQKLALTPSKSNKMKPLPSVPFNLTPAVAYPSNPWLTWTLGSKWDPCIPFQDIQSIQISVMSSSEYYHLSAVMMHYRRLAYEYYLKSLDPQSLSNTLSPNSLFLNSTASSGHPLDGNSVSRYVDSLIRTERTIDHASIRVEWLTKCYEGFKKRGFTRRTILMAGEIGKTYMDAKKFDMALRFFDRVAKTYRKEKWYAILATTLENLYRCAIAKQDFGVAIETLIELQSRLFVPSPKHRLELTNALQNIMFMPNPNKSELTSPQNIVIEMDSLRSSIDCHFQFKTSSGYVGNTPVLFQIALRLGGVDLSESNLKSVNSSTGTLLLRSVTVITNQGPDMISYAFVNRDSLDDKGVVDYINGIGNVRIMKLKSSQLFNVIAKSSQELKIPNLNNLNSSSNQPKSEINLISQSFWTFDADLTLKDNETLVLEGAAVGISNPAEFSVTSIVVQLESVEDWNVFLVWKGSNSVLETTGKETSSKKNAVLHDSRKMRKWYIVKEDKKLKKLCAETILLDGVGENRLLRVSHRQPQFRMEIVHDPPGLLDEFYKVRFIVRNGEMVDMRAHISLNLEMTGLNEPGMDLMYFDLSEQEGKSEFQNVDLGIISANAFVEKDVYIRCSLVAGARCLTSIVHFRRGTDSFSESSFSATAPKDVYSMLVEKVTIGFNAAVEVSFEMNPLPESSGSVIQHTGVFRDLGVYTPRGSNINNSLDIVKQEDLVLVVVAIKNVSPFNLVLEKPNYHSNNDEEGVLVKVISTSMDEEINTEANSPVWRPGAVCKLYYQFLVQSKLTVPSPHLGLLEVNWRRANKETGKLACSNVQFPQYENNNEIVSYDVSKVLTFPTYIFSNEPFTATYIITNRSLNEVVELDTVLDQSDSFVYSGNKQLSLRILPLQTIRISILYWALQTGNVKLPQFHLIQKKINGESTVGKDIGGSGVPIFLFVRPEKGNLVE